MYAAAAYIIAERSREAQLRVERRNLRDNLNILDLSESEFVANFRVSKDVFVDIYEDTKMYMQHSFRNTHLPVQLKLSTFLRFLATGSYQKSVGNEHISAMSQSTVAKVISECLDIFQTHFCKKWIVFQRTTEEENNTKAHFFNECGLPGVIGCVDGTHIRIKSPGENLRHLYYNRKGYYSLNVMLICDHNMVITYVDARHPGANHDSFVWKHSTVEHQLKSAYNSGRTNTWLLGDSGYPLQPYLMTPFRTASDEMQRRYNEKHKKGRNIIERCIGVIKNRFRSILGSRGLHYSADKAKKIVNACCAIHNSCIFFKHQMSFPPLIEEDINAQELPVEDIRSIASNIRLEIAENLQ